MQPNCSVPMYVYNLSSYKTQAHIYAIPQSKMFIKNRNCTSCAILWSPCKNKWMCDFTMI